MWLVTNLFIHMCRNYQTFPNNFNVFPDEGVGGVLQSSSPYAPSLLAPLLCNVGQPCVNFIHFLLIFVK